MAIQDTKMPHNGSLLEKYVNESGLGTAAITKHMRSKRTTLKDLYFTPSLRMHIWWDVGVAINQNLFGDFAERFPIPYHTKRELELEEEVKNIRMELEIYKRIVEKR